MLLHAVIELKRRGALRAGGSLRNPSVNTKGDAMLLGQEALVQLNDGNPRIVIGKITDTGHDLIRDEDFIRIDGGARIYSSNVYGIRTI